MDVRRPLVLNSWERANRSCSAVVLDDLLREMGEFAAVQLRKLLQIDDVFRLVREGVGMRTRPGDRGHVALVSGPASAACQRCCGRYEDCRECREKDEKSLRYPMRQGAQSSFREMLRVCCQPDAREGRTRIGPSGSRLVHCVSAIASQPTEDRIAEKEGKSLRNRRLGEGPDDE